MTEPMLDDGEPWRYQHDPATGGTWINDRHGVSLDCDVCDNTGLADGGYCACIIGQQRNERETRR